MEGTHGESKALPVVEVGASVDSTGGTLVLADGPVLHEVGGALNGWCVDLLVNVYVISTAVRLKGAFLDHAVTSGRATGAVVLADVVFRERIFHPTVDGKERDSLRLIIGLVVDVTSSSGLETLANDHVAGVGPGQIVVASISIGVLDIASAVAPH